MARDKKATDDKKPVSWKWRLFVWCFNLCLIVALGIVFYVAMIYFQMPSLDAILNETRAPAIVFMDRDGNEIRSDNKIMGTPVSVETLPPHVWQAIVAIEDKRFFNHGPFDTRSMIRAVVLNIFRGRFAVGGSSITQQTAKNISFRAIKKFHARCKS